MQRGMGDGVMSSMSWDRYERQMRIAGWGPDGQRRLSSARVVIAGIGGLGGFSSLLLGEAGVGTLILIDRDVVELSNLNRQPLYSEGDLGRPKAESAAEKIARLNSSIDVIPLQVEIDNTTFSTLGRVDAIVDGLDNFKSRFLVNEESVRRGIPFFHGSVYGLEGRATTLIPGRTPCLRCLYPSAREEPTVPVCGMVPAVVASIQALEVVKLLTGVGTLLEGRMLLFDGEDQSFEEIRISRNPNCPICAGYPST